MMALKNSRASRYEIAKSLNPSVDIYDYEEDLINGEITFGMLLESKYNSLLKYNLVQSEIISILFFTWLSKIEREDHIVQDSIRENLEDLEDYFIDTMDILQEVKVSISSKETITTQDLKRIESIAKLKNLTNTFVEKVDIYFNFELNKRLYGDDVRNSKQKLENLSHTFNLIKEIRLELKNANIALNDFDEILRKIVKAIESKKSDIEETIKEESFNYMESKRFKELKALITISQFSEILSDSFSDIINDNKEKDLKDYFQTVDIVKDFDLGEIGFNGGEEYDF